MWKITGNTLWAKPVSDDNGVQGSVVIMRFILNILFILAAGDN
jgi:hypothetical protein